MRMRVSLGAALCLIVLLSPIPTADAATVVTCGGPAITSSITVANSLHDCPGAGLTIDGNNIVVDLGGNVIDGNDAGTDVGITVTNFSENVLITNGTIKGFHDGILFDAFAHDGRVSRTTVTANTQHGVNVKAFRARISRLEAIDNVGDGLMLDGGEEHRIRNSLFTRNGDDGLETIGFAAQNLIEENRFLANGNDGLVVASSQNTITENRSIGNGGDGFQVDRNNNRINLNTLRGNRIDGISITGTDNRIKSNRIFGNGLGGVFVNDDVIGGSPSVGDRNVLRSNNIRYNDLEGIRTTQFASFSTVKRNTVADNGQDGILVEGDSTDVTENVVRRNGFAVADGGNFGIRVTGSDLSGRDNRASDNDVADPAVQCSPNPPRFCR